ncbi:branched-chain amino acid ABC transporter permease [Pseudorhodoplanes sp.]|uniref:branched-chain amino acid ABC transporter permease n=1 Tax=Pseudorhodoplanes sp. TaxID=1934341 RepID=UPI003D144FB9
MTTTTFLQLLVFGLVWGGLYALIASGLNIVFGVMKILNIAHGELLMIGAYISFWMFTLWHVSPLVSVPIAAVAMGLLGIAIQKALVEPIGERIRSVAGFENATLIVFFGVLLILQNLATQLWTADYRVTSYLTAPVNLGFDLSVAANRLVVLACAIVLTILMFLFLRYTFAGKAIRAVSQDRDTARLMGIDAKNIGLLGFGLAAAIAGAAGALASMIYVITPTIGLLFTIKAFTVMVIGGLGNQVGIFLAGLALGVLESFASYAIGAEFKDATGYILLIGFILWRARTSAAFAGEIK